MWTPLAERHAIELMLVGTLIDLPIGYVAFWFVSRADMLRDRLPLHSPRILGLCAGAGMLWGVTVFVNMLLIPGESRLAHEVVPRLADVAPMLAVPIAFATAIAMVRTVRYRAVIAVVGVLVHVLVVEGLLGDRQFLEADPGVQASVLAFIAAATILYGVGLALLSIRSHVGRAAAVICPVWASQILGFTFLAYRSPDHFFLHAEAGTVTWQSPVSITIYVAFVATLAVAEARRLARERNRVDAIEASEERMRLLAEVSQEGILVHCDGVVVDSNTRMRVLTGFGDLNGRQVRDLLRAGREDDVPADGDAARLLRSDGDTIPVAHDAIRLGDGRDVTTVRDLTAAREAARKIRFLAENDALTGLLNRRAFDDIVERAAGKGPREGSAPRALMMIDLDRFKPVNDTFGHAAGDAVLRELGVRLPDVLREADAAARIGGDEFAAVVRVPGRREAETLAERARAVVTRPVRFDGQDLTVGASVGVAMIEDVAFDADADPDARATAWRAAADLALYAAKEAGRDRVVVYDEAMGRRARVQRAFEDDLRQALARGQIELHYQAQRDLALGRTVGYEALMRWRHPERGAVPPSEFIPLAEEMGVIAKLGAWALERAARDFATFDAETRVSVNVSARQFELGDVLADVCRALEVSGLAPERLELEVTESVLMSDTGKVLETLEKLHELGVGLSLDDFGTGYASLAYLTRFPFSKIKIDRAFIEDMGADPRSRSLVRSILAMAGSLDMRVTAEGVETYGQLLSLAKDACDEAQGFLLAHPVPFDEIVTDPPMKEYRPDEDEKTNGGGPATRLRDAS